MPTGISLPLEAEAGRLKLLSGDDYMRQLVAMALGDNDSDNPFQSLGMGEWMIFAINDQAIEGEIRQRVRAVFIEFEKDQLMKLSTDADAITFEEREGERIMRLKYLNLETGLRVDQDVPLPPAGV